MWSTTRLVSLFAIPTPDPLAHPPAAEAGRADAEGALSALELPLPPPILAERDAKE